MQDYRSSRIKSSVAPFTIIIDSMEQHPFGFTEIAVDKSQLKSSQRRAVDVGLAEAIIDVPIIFKSLGAGNGDYAIDGMQGRCNIERKSMEDCHGTVLGWGDRRERFKRELENLASMESAAIVVECSFGDLLATAPERGKKSSAENRKILFRQILSWQQRYRVPWLFCDSRRMAEITTFRWLEKFFNNQAELEKEAQ
jgi:hypothetical protein